MPFKMDSGFVKADSTNLPKINLFQVWKYTVTDERYNAPEVRSKSKIAFPLRSKSNSNDIGAPLVVGNRVAGLVTRAHKNCDDREHGALYTNVSAHYDFVHNTILGIKVECVHVIPIEPLETPKEDQ